MAVTGQARIVLRPIGTPLPLALLALAVASLLLAGQDLGWYQQAQDPRVLGFVLAGFAFPLQFAAAMWSIAARSAVAAASAGVLAGAWLATGLVYVTTATGGGPPPGPLGVLYAGVAIALVLIGLAEGVSSALAPAVAFALAGVRFAAQGLYALDPHVFWRDLSGVLGLAVAAAAGYTAVALLFRSGLGRDVLPIGHRADTAASDPLAGVSHEPGLRSTL